MEKSQDAIKLVASQVTTPESPEDWLVDFIERTRPELNTLNYTGYLIVLAQEFHRKKMAVK